MVSIFIRGSCLYVETIDMRREDRSRRSDYETLLYASSYLVNVDFATSAPQQLILIARLNENCIFTIFTN